MSSIPLFDYALSSANRLSSREQTRLTRFAESLVKSVLDDVDRLELFEESVPANPSGGEAKFDYDVAVLLRYNYEECVKRAEQVLQRVERLEARGQKVKGAERLRDAHGRLAAMMSISLDKLMGVEKPSRKQKVHPASELRHELQNRLHK